MPRTRKLPPPAPEPEPIHVRLRRLVNMKRAGRTDGEIAEAAGISREGFSRLLSGKYADLKVSTLVAILKALDARFGDLDDV